MENQGNRLLLVGLVLLSLTACSKPESKVAQVGDRSVSAAEVAAYLQYKRVDSSNEALAGRATEHYLQSLALIQSIEQQGGLDLQRIEVELTELKKDLLLNTYLQDFLEQAVTETAMRNYYAQNESNYQSRRAKVAHILLRVQPDMTEAERQAKYSKAMEAYSKLRTGVPFVEVAATYSEDSLSATKGGQLGWLQEGAISPVFSQQVFTRLSVNEVSEPVLTEFGYHLILLEQEPVVVKQSFESVRGDIRRILRSLAREAELERLQQSVPIKRYTAS